MHATHQLPWESKPGCFNGRCSRAFTLLEKTLFVRRDCEQNAILEIIVLILAEWPLQPRERLGNGNAVVQKTIVAQEV